MNIQYTSGTTGFPKGCMLSHRYWATLGKVNAFRDGRSFTRILAATPFFYMDPQWLLLMAFYQRGTLYVARRQSSSRFMSWLREHRIEFCLLPEIVLKQPPDPRDRDNAIIRVNVYGLQKEVHAELEDRFDLVAREAFGMTEIGSGMFMPIEATDMIGSGSCGKPSPFREARIVNNAGKPVDGRPDRRAPDQRSRHVAGLLQERSGDRGRVPGRLVPDRATFSGRMNAGISTSWDGSRT